MDSIPRLDVVGYLKSGDPRDQWLGMTVIVLAVYWVANLYIARSKRFVDVPVAGHSGPLSSYITALNSVLKGHLNIAAGYEKYKGHPFKAAEISRWHVFVSGNALMDQLRKAPENVLYPVAAKEHLQADVLINPTILSEKYHIGLVSHLFTRQLLHVFPTMADELKRALSTNIPASEDWISVKVMDTMLRSVCQITNRIFVGEKLCRDKEWIMINVKFTIDCFMGANVVTLFPAYLQSLAGKWLTMAPSRMKHAEKLLLPLVVERMEMIDRLGKDSEELPNDSITWLLNHAPPVERTPKQIAGRILGINVAAIHSTATNFTQVLYMLCAYPEYVPDLRAEVEQAIENDGWSKHSMMKCRKVDSFIKETFRMWPSTVAILERIALQDFTLVDGTFIPKGTRISGISGPMMRDPQKWGPTAGEFDGYRFSKMRLDESESMKNQIVQTSLEFVLFGHGQHACPGRFFAANEIKALTAYTLLNYDFKYKNPKMGHGDLPEMMWFNTAASANPNEEVLFRRRQT